MTDDDGWAATLDDLDARRTAARAMGGTERVARHRSGGKLDARARVARLLDPGSFVEIGTLAGGDVPADGLVAGSGTIDGRPVMVGAEDFTTLGGTIGAGSGAKRHRIAELALADRVPLVMLLEGAGHRPSDRTGGRTPVDLMMQARCSGQVPVITAIMGPSAGHGALIVPMSDFTVITALGSVFTAGPPVVKESTGETVTKEDLGGPAVAVASGLVHNVAADDDDALDQIRCYLSYFPASAWSYPPTAPDSGDLGPRRLDAILDLVPRDSRRTYDMRSVITMVVDGGRWFEVRSGFGKAMLCGLAHLGGNPVGIVANQPLLMAGAIDSAAADKAAHFINVADAFHLPLVFLTDNPGMLPGSSSERSGVLRSGARMYAAQTLATTPKLQVTLRKAYGFGSMVMALGAFESQTVSLAFPGVTLGAMGSSASSKAMKADADVEAELRRAELDASYRSAAFLGFDELIDPRDVRTALLSGLTRSLSRRQSPAMPVLRSTIAP